MGFLYTTGGGLKMIKVEYDCGDDDGGTMATTYRCCLPGSFGSELFTRGFALREVNMSLCDMSEKWNRDNGPPVDLRAVCCERRRR